jgi:hypothetical protein
MPNKLSIDDIEVPEGMLDAFVRKMIEGRHAVNSIQNHKKVWRADLAAALLWLAENPIAPSEEDVREIWGEMSLRADTRSWEDVRDTATELHRRMFLRKTGALPDEVKDLLITDIPDFPSFSVSRELANYRITRAYQFGKEGK